jgi:hypothetical protein
MKEKIQKKYRLNRMIRLAGETNTEIDSVQYRPNVYKPLKNLTNKLIREVGKKYLLLKNECITKNEKALKQAKDGKMKFIFDECFNKEHNT